VTVLDTSAAIDYLLGAGVSSQVEALLTAAAATAPDLLVFEVLAVLRRAVGRRELTQARAGAALDDLGDMTLDLFPTLPLRSRAWELRRSMTAGDALFVALAEALGEPLATKDGGLARAAARHADVEVLVLGTR
jgi:predicted nucleic acid-binding protein